MGATVHRWSSKSLGEQETPDGGYFIMKGAPSSIYAGLLVHKVIDFNAILNAPSSVVLSQGLRGASGDVSRRP